MEVVGGGGGVGDVLRRLETFTWHRKLKLFSSLSSDIARPPFALGQRSQARSLTRQRGQARSPGKNRVCAGAVAVSGKDSLVVHGGWPTE